MLNISEIKLLPKATIMEGLGRISRYLEVLPLRLIRQLPSYNPTARDEELLYPVYQCIICQPKNGCNSGVTNGTPLTQYTIGFFISRKGPVLVAVCGECGSLYFPAFIPTEVRPFLQNGGLGNVPTLENLISSKVGLK